MDLRGQERRRHTNTTMPRESAAVSNRRVGGYLPGAVEWPGAQPCPYPTARRARLLAYHPVTARPRRARNDRWVALPFSQPRLSPWVSEPGARGVRHAEGRAMAVNASPALHRAHCLALLIVVARRRAGPCLQRNAVGGGDHGHHGSEAIGCPRFGRNISIFRATSLLVDAPWSPAAP